MAHGTKEDIETVDNEDPRSKWPRTAEAVHKYGLRKATLERLVRQGKIPYVYDDSAERLHDPAALQEHSDIITDANDHEIDADVTTTVLGLLKGTNKDLTRSFSDLLKLSIGPHQEFIAALMAENLALRAECEKLRERYASNIESFEAALTQSHERELARVKAENHETRLSNALNKALEQLPALVTGISGKKSVTTLFESLTPEQKTVLFELLQPHQLSIVTKLIASHGNGAGTPVKGTEQQEENQSS